MKNTFSSLYTDKKISASQYLAERMCERIAKKDGKDLPYKFWQLVSYKRMFLQQLNIANSLLKLYSIRAILNALQKMPQVYSLGAQFLDPIIKQEQIKLDRQQPTVPVEDKKVDTTKKPRPSFIEKKSTISKLREL